MQKYEGKISEEAISGQPEKKGVLSLWLKAGRSLLLSSQRPSERSHRQAEEERVVRDDVPSLNSSLNLVASTSTIGAPPT
jgi:hypothetical protein